MAPSYVQVAKGTASSSAVTTGAFGSPTTTGNLIVVVVALTAAANNVTSVTDNKSNSYTKVFSASSAGGASLDVWYSANITGGASHTVTASNGFNFTTCIVANEYSGVLTASPLDVSVSASGSSSSPASGSTATTAQASELVIGASTTYANATTISVGSGYSNFNQQQDTTTLIAAQESNVVSATGAQSASFGASPAAAWWTCGCVTFKGAPGPIGKRTTVATAVTRSYFY